MEEKYPELSQKGLDEEEIKMLTTWIDQGKPGLSKIRAERFGDIYILGYSCKDINKMFPEYPLETLLFARAQYDWDKLRAEYRARVSSQTLEMAITSRLDSIKFLTEMVSATHIKWRKEIMNYIANPDKVKPPDCLPKSIQGYSQVISTLQALVSPGSSKSGSGGGPNAATQNTTASPLVSVTVKTDKHSNTDVTISNSAQDAVKEALLAELLQSEKDE